MNTMKETLAVIILAVVLSCLTACGSKVKTIEDRVFALQDTTTTPAGVRIRTEQGVNVSADVLRALDRGFATTFKKTRCKYNNSLQHSDLIVAVVKGEMYNGHPVYRLPCAQYCGTEYDKGGYIFASGQTVAVGTPYGNVIAIPEQFSDLANAELIAEFEAEHVSLAYFDGPEYEATKTHSNGQGHPIIPYCQGSERSTKLISIPSAMFCPSAPSR